MPFASVFADIPRRSSGYNLDELLPEKGFHVARALVGCGMAGAFGFEDRHYDISMKCGERVLLPKVREAAKSTLIIADGFSCREQIKSATDRRGLHLAQVIKMALDRSSPRTSYPEKIYVRPATVQGTKPLLAAVGIAGAVSFLLWKVLNSSD